jgi:uncharacterized membrane protein
MTPQPEPVLFHAVRTPPSSFTRRGFRWMVALAMFGALLPTALAVSLGAWPVLGFLGGEIALVLGLVAWHARRSARVSETLLLVGDRFVIARCDARGQRDSIELDPYWLRVQLEERPEGPGRLLLLQRGRETEIGRSLGAEDRRALAESLRDALGRYRSPVFDNPQLRD